VLGSIGASNTTLTFAERDTWVEPSPGCSITRGSAASLAVVNATVRSDDNTLPARSRTPAWPPVTVTTAVAFTGKPSTGVTRILVAIGLSTTAAQG